MAERPVPPGWESRPQLYPVGGVPGGDGVILRDVCSRVANRMHGCFSGDPATERQLEAFLFSYDEDATRRAMADSMYNCALASGALCDCLGAEGTGADSPYAKRGGMAVADVKKLGIAMGAWVDMTAIDAPLPAGPACVLMGDNGAQGAEHWENTLDGIDDDGEVHTFGGGRKTAKGYGISKAVYQFERRDPKSVWARQIAPTATPWRRVMGYIDLEACLFTQRATVPSEDGPEAA